VRKYFVPTLLILCFALAKPAFAQDRFDSGPNKGFTQSPTEHIIVEIDSPFVVRVVRGFIKNPQGYGLPEVTFEIRDESGRIRGVKTDEMGKFKVSEIAPGTYSFKATKDGFQSVVGKIVVAKKSNHKASIQLTMPLGV
jgi:hypothetical protein